jgi:hypothetical protein
MEKDSVMNQIAAIEKLNRVSSIISQGLSKEPFEQMPPEVAETLTRAQAYMENIPEALADLAAARERYDILNRSIDRLLGLARKASEETDTDSARNINREKEFVELARIVAQEAGREKYNGPELSVATPAHAKGALRVLNKLIPVKETLGQELSDQERLIFQAVEETLTFLEAVAQSYPEAAILSGIPDLLQRVVWARENESAGRRVGWSGNHGPH